VLDPGDRVGDAGVVTRHWWLSGPGAMLSAAAAAVCLFVPLADADDGSGVPGATLLEANGRGVLVPLALFVLLATGAWLAPSRRLRVILSGGHAALSVLALLSIGVFFLPATVVLLGGTVVDVRTPAPTRAHRPLVPSA
jgi:hypothetical protein